MNTAKSFGNLVVAAAVLSSACICSAAEIYPVNDGFEIPNLGSGSNAFGYGDANPYGLGVPTFIPNAGQGWTFTGTAGIAANGSGFNVTGATNGNQNGGATSTSGQAGFIQNGYGTPNTISQTLTGYDGGPTEVTFSLELRRTNDPTTAVDVKLNGIDLGTYSAASTSSFNTVTTPIVYIPGGSYQLTFTGVNGANGQDNTDFIDNVSVNVVPEPSMPVAFLSLAAIGLLLVARRSRGAQACGLRGVRT
jgi:hypothetical protein